MLIRVSPNAFFASVVALIVTVLHVALVPTPALAQPVLGSATPAILKPPGISKWAIDDRDPESSIPNEEQRNKDPIEFGYFLMDASARAEAALQRGDFKEAIAMFKVLAKAVPNRAVAFTKLCQTYRMVGQWENARQACRTALDKESVQAEDFANYIGLMLEKSQLTRKDQQDIDDVIRHVREQSPNDAFSYQLDCEVAAKLKDTRRFETCATRLAELVPDSPATVTFQWAYAILRNDIRGATRILEKARGNVNMAPSALAQMEQSTRDAEDKVGIGRVLSWLVPVLVLIALGAGLTLITRRRRQLSAVS